jgi:hypothetical protein
MQKNLIVLGVKGNNSHFGRTKRSSSPERVLLAVKLDIGVRIELNK